MKIIKDQTGWRNFINDIFNSICLYSSIQLVPIENSLRERTKSDIDILIFVHPVSVWTSPHPHPLVLPCSLCLPTVDPAELMHKVSAAI
jgi:hypothetical protein